MIANENTPVEQYGTIWVKREDLACNPPGPPFSKIRGLEAKLFALLKEGIKIVGYCDTSVSMAAWGVSYFCQQFGMMAIIFYPKYKEGNNRENLEDHIKKWQEFGATIVPIDKPQRQKINWYRARNILLKNWPNSFMLEQGFPYNESVTETAKQVKLIPEKLLDGTIVISVGSGVICSGVVKGLLELDKDTLLYGITVSPKDLDGMEKKIRTRSNDVFGIVNLELINGGYEYTQMENMEVPFNCNKFYDRKAWNWLIKHEKELKEPILFWNIGGEGK
jgi:1-aminocyclopropane-1-carboxylate deaminase/D-cysteine desulfhydrase-like pyridoxal-dependent ACC family enzyme